MICIAALSPVSVLRLTTDCAGKENIYCSRNQGLLTDSKTEEWFERDRWRTRSSFIIVPSVWWLGVLEFSITKYTSSSLPIFVYAHTHTHIYLHILVFIFSTISVINKGFIFILNCTSRLSMEGYGSSMVVYNSSGKVTLHLIKLSMCFRGCSRAWILLQGQNTAVPLYDRLFLFIKTIKPSVHLSTLLLKLSWVSVSSTGTLYFNSLTAIKLLLLLTYN